MACGDLYREQGELERALLYYERAQRAGVKGATVLLRQAQIEIERERYKQAVAILEEAQRIDSSPFVSRYLAQVRRFVR
jgi:tetratricopeptide (TPR) repeat protein